MNREPFFTLSDFLSALYYVATIVILLACVAAVRGQETFSLLR